MYVYTVAAIALAAGAVAIGCVMPAQTGVAQERNLTETLPKWSQTHYNRFGSWESICETKTDGDPVKSVALAEQDGQRCYVRYIDKLNPWGMDNGSSDTPSIAAFISPDANGLKVEFGIQSELKIERGGFYLSREDKAVWVLDPDDCAPSGLCTFTGPAALALVRAFSDQSGESLEMHVAFTDHNGERLVRTWPMFPFANAYSDFESNLRRLSM